MNTTGIFTSSIRLKLLMAFGSAIAALAVIAGLGLQSTRDFIKAAQAVSQTHRIVESHEALLRHFMEAESAARGYLISGDDVLLGFFEQAGAEAIAEGKELAALIREEPAQAARLKSIMKRMEHKLATLRQLTWTRQTEGPETAVEKFSAMNQEGATTELRSMMAAFQLAEELELEQRSTLSRQIGKETKRRVLLSSCISLVLLIGAMALVLRDIEARQRAEALLAQERNLLRNLIDAIPDHIYVKDLEGRYILDNVAHRKFLGVDELEKLMGHTVFDFAPRELALIYHADDQSVFETGTPILNREEPAVDPEGKLVWLLANKVPLRGLNGETIGLVCVGSDISERKASEEKLRVFAAQLERSNAELRDFASVASHDLQEPLRKIRAFSDRLRVKCGDVLQEQGLDYLDRMQKAAGRMQTLIQDLLTLSHVTSRAQPFVTVDLNAVMGEVLSDLEIPMEQTNALIEVGKLPTIDADPVQMRQLFQNLLSNAIKFHKPDQPPEVTVSAKVLPAQEHQIAGAGPGDDLCQIVVADNGIGFEAQYVEQVFTLFQRLHSRQEYEGTGIGLAVCRKIASRHGGSIVAKSEKGQGATFIVRLPVKQITKS